MNFLSTFSSMQKSHSLIKYVLSEKVINFGQSSFFEHALKGKREFTLKKIFCDFARMQPKGTFDNHIPTYFSSKVSRYFIFRYLITPYYQIFVSSNYLKIGYFKKQTLPFHFKTSHIHIFTEIFKKRIICQKLPSNFLRRVIEA